MPDPAIGVGHSAAPKTPFKGITGAPRKRQRGIPPPPEFDLAKLADGTLLATKEVAAVLRCSLVQVEFKRRKKKDAPLDWRCIDRRWLCTAGSLRKSIEHKGQGQK